MIKAKRLARMKAIGKRKFLSKLGANLPENIAKTDDLPKVDVSDLMRAYRDTVPREIQD